MTDQDQNQERAGAEATSEMLAPNAFTPTPEDLPMLVWLKGTEPWFEEFSLEADQVMDMLGIKRTRLTQISGRELRVGRVRRGRYISPVFRPEDVERYLSWVRAPVSHLKSSSMLNEAADTLRQQADDLEQGFFELKSTITEDFEHGIRLAMRQSQDLAADSRLQVTSDFTAFSQQMTERISWLARRHDGMTDQMASMTMFMEKLLASQMALLKSLQESQVRTATELGNKIETMGRALSILDEKLTAQQAQESEKVRKPGRIKIRQKQRSRVRPVISEKIKPKIRNTSLCITRVRMLRARTK